MSKAPSKPTSIATLPSPEEIPENRLAQALAHNILRSVAVIIPAYHLLNAAFQDETSRFALAIHCLERESYDPSATLETVRELYSILQNLLETYREASDDPNFRIPPALLNSFDTKVGFARDAVLEEMQEETVHESAKRVILGREQGGISAINLHIRTAVSREILEIISFAMINCYLEFGDEKVMVAEILDDTNASVIFALLGFNNLLLDTMARTSENYRFMQLATIIKAIRREIKGGTIPTPKKRRELVLETHEPSARVEGLDIGNVGTLERVIVSQSGRWPRNTGAHSNPESSPDEK